MEYLTFYMFAFLMEDVQLFSHTLDLKCTSSKLFEILGNFLRMWNINNLMEHYYNKRIWIIFYSGWSTCKVEQNFMLHVRKHQYQLTECSLVFNQLVRKGSRKQVLLSDSNIPRSENYFHFNKDRSYCQHLQSLIVWGLNLYI